MEVVSGDNWTTGAISRAKLQSNHHHQQTNIQFFLQARCPSCRQTNSIKALHGKTSRQQLAAYDHQKHILGCECC